MKNGLELSFKNNVCTQDADNPVDGSVAVHVLDTVLDPAQEPVDVIISLKVTFGVVQEEDPAVAVACPVTLGPGILPVVIHPDE